MILINSLPTVPARTFTWVDSLLQPGTKVGVCNDSDIQPSYYCGKFYDNACGIGFMVEGQSKRIAFVCVHTEWDREGEARFWRFASTNLDTGRPDGRFLIEIHND